jgi:hypothetical protein
MTATYEKIATSTLGSTASDVTFSSISGSYTDLVLIVNETCSTGSGLNVQFNSDTGSNYSSTYMYGDVQVRRLADNQINLSELLAILVEVL